LVFNLVVFIQFGPHFRFVFN